jgi:hypothetical protein
MRAGAPYRAGRTSAWLKLKTPALKSREAKRLEHSGANRITFRGPTVRKSPRAQSRAHEVAYWTLQAVRRRAA